MAETWTVIRCLNWTIEYLASKGDETPRVSAEWLLSSVLDVPRINLYTDPNRPLAPDELARMHESVVRRAKGEPIQYITGDTAFRSLTIQCEPGVLIPRPETEMLVEEVLSFLDARVFEWTCEDRRRHRIELPWNDEVEAKRRAEQEAAAARAAEQRETAGEDDGASSETDEESTAAAPEVVAQPANQQPEAAAPRHARVLEVGCGTGCISLSLAFERAGLVSCVATDIEPRAVALACKNREALGIAPETVDIREGNLVSPLDRATEWGTFDVLVSNPPYIPTAVLQVIPREVTDFEPALALDGGADGLDIFRRLVNAAPCMLRPGGLLACELHETTLDDAARICLDAGFEEIRIARDLAGRTRFILATVPQRVCEEARARFDALARPAGEGDEPVAPAAPTAAPESERVE